MTNVRSISRIRRGRRHRRTRIATQQPRGSTATLQRVLNVCNGLNVHAQCHLSDETRSSALERGSVVTIRGKVKLVEELIGSDSNKDDESLTLFIGTLGDLLNDRRVISASSSDVELADPNYWTDKQVKQSDWWIQQVFARAKRLKETTTTQEKSNRNKDGRTLKRESSAKKHSSERKQRNEAKRNKR